jgi:hypothetical protein
MRTLSEAVVGAFLLLVWLSACNQGPEKRANEWPPFVGWAQDNFRKNQSSLEALEAMLLASEFYEVKGGGAITVGVYSGPDDGHDREDILEGNNKWASHLRKASVFSVSREDGYTAYPTGIDPFWDKRDYQHVDGYSELIGTLTYIHIRNMDEEEVVCHARYQQSKCGACVVSLAPNWLAYYTWSAASFSPTNFAASSENSFEREEKEILARKAEESCYADWIDMTASSLK